MEMNAFFYEAAEGLLTAVILLIAEFCPPEKRHIISVFKLIQDLLEDSYSIEEKSERKVQYADSREVEAAVLERFPPKPVSIEFAENFDGNAEEFSAKKQIPKTRKK